MNIVHVTHEAVEKIGGIGAVVAGLMNAESYKQRVGRTILLGPLLETGQPVNRRLGPDGQILYSSLDDIRPPEWRDKFSAIERTYDVGIIYGRRNVYDFYTGKGVDAEVLLIDVFHFNPDRLNLFKGELYHKFKVPSDRFENVWEYEQYVRLAEPGFEALKTLGVCDGDEPTVLLAHEYMGMPTALKSVLDGARRTRTAFYAHEVASVRRVVEKRPGHDTMFYNTMKLATGRGQTLEEVFPQVLDNFKHPLVKAARYCDHVFAVGDYIESELRFIDPHFRTMDIDLVYNGIPAIELTAEQKNASRQRMLQYAENLTGRRPDWVFTHVARPVLSKGIWRDLRICHELEGMLAERGETATFFMLGTLAGQRRPKDIRHMERVYGWPVVHEHGYPDLCQGEEVLGEMFEAFNADHAATDAIYVNQWDWNRQVCGERMPEEMSFSDIRRGTDVEFGLSVYEPFGIANFEPLCFGALCAVSSVCGCMGSARRLQFDGGYDDNIIEADYLTLPEGADAETALQDPDALRDRIEGAEGRRLAELIFEKLPRSRDVATRRTARGLEIAARMDWEHVVDRYFLPSLDRAASSES